MTVRQFKTCGFFHVIILKSRFHFLLDYLLRTLAKIREMHFHRFDLLISLDCLLSSNSSPRSADCCSLYQNSSAYYYYLHAAIVVRFGDDVSCSASTSSSFDVMALDRSGIWRAAYLCPHNSSVDVFSCSSDSRTSGRNSRIGPSWLDPLGSCAVGAAGIVRLTRSASDSDSTNSLDGQSMCLGWRCAALARWMASCASRTHPTAKSD